MYYASCPANESGTAPFGVPSECDRQSLELYQFPWYKELEAHEGQTGPGRDFHDHLCVADVLFMSVV
jgi:hypothetical protein